ncbi:MAG: DUF4012 domain-containing protein [Mycobacteriales bacterium]|nr:DUF4012 domain-containing protein [Mycobacteriales bacterium]
MLSRRARRWRRRGRPVWIALLALSSLLLLGSLVLAFQLRGVSSDLSDAADDLRSAQSAIADGDLDAARRDVATARTHSAAARDTTDGPLWRAYGRLPLVGTAVNEVRVVSTALALTTDEVLPRLVAVDVQQSRWTGAIDSTPFVKAQVPLRAAGAALARTRDLLVRTPSARITPLGDARDELETALRSLSQTVGEASVAAEVVPSLVGSDTPRRYFLALQNTAEARATGGLIATFGILRADRGRLVLERVGSTQELVDTESPALDLGDEYDRRYSRFETTSTWRAANLSPHLPSVGPLLTALWERQTGQRLDGAVLADPVALSLLLGATGPVSLSDGTRLTESNAVETLLAGVYRRFPDRQEAERNSVYQDAARAVFARLGRPGLNPRRLVDRVGRAAASGHLQVWSAEPDVEAQLVQSRVGGALLSAGPYLEVLTQDVGGTKLDYYLRRAVTYDARPTDEAIDLGEGAEFEEEAEVTVRLTNAAPVNLPSYVTTRRDVRNAPVGQAKTWLSVYLGRRATVLGATLDGREVAVETQTERGLTAVSLFLTLDRGQARSFVLRVRQPAMTSQPLRVRQQPRTRQDDVVVRRQGAPVPVELVYAPPSGTS